MEVRLQRSSIPCWQNVYSQSFSLSESEETVIPDTLPDAETILCASGSPLIRSKDITDGHLRMEANVPARVTCVGEGNRAIFCLDVNIPFYLSVQDERVRENCACMAELCLRQLEPRLLNPRKITLRAEIEVTVKCYEPSAIETALAPEEEAAEIHTLEREEFISCIAAVTEKTFVLTDEYALPDASAAVAEILGQRAAVKVEEIKTLGSKVVVTGAVNSELLYRCEEGEVHALRFQTAFSQIIEAPCDAEDSCIDISILLSGMYYEAISGSDGREIAMELHLVTQMLLWKDQTISYIADAYSNTCSLEIGRRAHGFLRIEKETAPRESCRAAVETPEPVKTVIACTAIPTGIEQNGDVITVTLRVTLCYAAENGARSIERTLNQRVNADLKAGESLLICAADVTEMSAVPVENGAELRFTLELRAFLAVEVTLNSVEEITLDENAPISHDDLPSLVIMKVCSSQDLWYLAKENCSTVGAIRSANALDTLSEPWEKLLLIPKTM